MSETQVVDDVQTPDAPANPDVAGSAEDNTETNLSESQASGLVSTIRANKEVIAAAVPLKDIRLPDTNEMNRIRKLQVPIIVRLANRQMPLGEILQLSPGAILEFNRNVCEQLDLMINNKCVGGGQAVKVGEKFGLKVIKLTTIDNMIRALGDKTP